MQIRQWWFYKPKLVALLLRTVAFCLQALVGSLPATWVAHSQHLAGHDRHHRWPPPADGGSRGTLGASAETHQCASPAHEHLSWRHWILQNGACTSIILYRFRVFMPRWWRIILSSVHLSNGSPDRNSPHFWIRTEISLTYLAFHHLSCTRFSHDWSAYLKKWN